MGRIYRLTLDEPYDLATEVGIAVARNSRDFAPNQANDLNVMREHTTGVVMLRPRIDTAVWTQDAVAPADLRYVTGAWSQVQRPATSTASWTALTTVTAASSPSSRDLDRLSYMVQRAIVAAVDYLAWAVETKYTVDHDEGFGFSFMVHHDEIGRHSNLAVMQCGDVAIHVGANGVAQVWRCIDMVASSALASWILVDEWQLSASFRAANVMAFLDVIPMPPWGILVRSSEQGGSRSLEPGPKGRAAALSSRFIPWPSTTLPDGSYSCTTGGLLGIALNPVLYYTVGVNRIRYPNTGVWLDAPQPLPYAPAGAPTSYGAYVLDGTAGTGSVASDLRNADADTALSVGAFAFRMKTTLTPSADFKRSPFMIGWHADWDPVYTERATTPRHFYSGTVTGGDRTRKLLSAEWHEDEQKRREGSAEVECSDADALAVLERGDATFVLRYTDNDGGAWTTVFGGLLEGPVPITFGVTGAGKAVFRSRLKLADMWARFGEVHRITSAPVDGMGLGTALNMALRGSGLPTITVPADLNLIRFKASAPGGEWNMAPKQGDSLEHVVELYLAMMRKQGLEYRLYWDWDTATMVLEQRNQDSTDVWELSPFIGDRDEGSQVWDYSDFEGSVSRAACSILHVAGVEEAGGQSTGSGGTRGTVRTVQTLVNPDYDDTASPNYLGRQVVAVVPIPEPDPDRTAFWARMIARLLFSRVYSGTVHCQKAQAALAPDQHVHLYDADGNLRLDGWVKARTTVIREAIETATVEVSTMWEGGIEG